jgi:lysyl-tRNA synthetase class 2
MGANENESRHDTLEKMRAAGLDPFGGRFAGAEAIASATGKFKEETAGISVTVSGRLTALRRHGKAAFGDLRDRTGRVQLYFREDRLGEKFRLYEFLNIGDIVGITGELFRTRTGEITINCDDLTPLCKSLRGLPEKWHGLTDVEVRYRKRYLDLISNPEVLQLFMRRAEIVRGIRTILDGKGFIEVETPMMHRIAGGASARPFITHHNALDMELYLRIAPELYLKRLLVGGMERVYEINRNFRNEGISTRHNPEFTMMELYEAYGDYNTMMDITEEIFTTLAAKYYPDMKVPFMDKVVDFTRPWKREGYLDLFERHAGFKWTDTAKVMEKARQLNVPMDKRPAEAIAADVFEALVEPHLEGPVFVIDYPTVICPLTKSKRERPEVAERFELYVCSIELANAFTELNDPIEQRKRFMKQIENKEEGTSKLDEDFIEAQEHGMPPAGGLGIDRLVMLLTNSRSIRDVILFPLMREQENVPPDAAKM